MIPLDRKLHFLDRLYRLYDQYIDTLNTACEKTCCNCCTCNVSITTLEAYRIVNMLTPEQLRQIKERVLDRIHNPRFIPKSTFNKIAYLCASGKEPPDEFMDHSWGKCPMLTDDICPVYHDRPFGCRCMVSKTSCAETGVAEMSEFTVTVNHLFLQMIEHIDQDGLSGNLSDILAYVIAERLDDQFRGKPPVNILISNSPLRSLLIPEEHKERILPLLKQIQALPI